MTRRPARETIAFAIALAALATLGGVAAASVAAAAPAADATTTTAPVAGAKADAPPNGSIDYDGERLTVESATDQRIAGTTTLAEGSSVTIRVRSSGEQPFLRQTVVSVNDNGSFATRMDFSDVERGVEFTVSVRHNGSTLAEAPAVVGACDPACGDQAGSAELGKNVAQVTQGESVELTVSLSDRDTATLVVGSEDTNMILPVVVTDGNGDGTVVVELQTAVQGPNDYGVAAASSADSVRVKDSATRPTVMDPADYDLSLYLGSHYEGQSEPRDIGTLVVTESTEDLGTTRTTTATTATTTVGTVYESATTDLEGSTGGLGLGTMGILAVGGVLAILGIVALVGGLN